MGDQLRPANQFYLKQGRAVISSGCYSVKIELTLHHSNISYWSQSFKRYITHVYLLYICPLWINILNILFGVVWS